VISLLEQGKEPWMIVRAEKRRWSQGKCSAGTGSSVLYAHLGQQGRRNTVGFFSTAFIAGHLHS